MSPNRMPFKKISVLLFMIFVSFNISFATDYYWISSSSSNWNNGANWSLSSGGVAANAVPNTLTDAATFDGGGVGNCTIDIAIDIDKIDIQSTISAGFILLQGSVDVKVNSFTIAGGSFSGSANIIAIKGAGTLNISGGVFKSTSGSLNFLPGATPSLFNFTASSSTSFNHNGGYLNVAAGNASLTIDNPTALLVLNNVNILDQGTTTFKYDCRIVGSLTLDNSFAGSVRNINIASGKTVTVFGLTSFQDHNGTSGPININTGTLDLKGDLNLKNNATGGGGSGTVSVTNTTTLQTITSTVGANQSAIPNFIITKVAGRLTFSGFITFIGPLWHYQSSGTIVSTGSTLYFYTPLGGSAFTINPPPSLANVYIRNDANGLTHTINNNLIVTNNLTIDAYATTSTTLAITNSITTKNLYWDAYQSLILNTGTINVNGDLTVGGTSPNIGGGTGTININGTVGQAFTGVATAGNGTLPNINISKLSGTVTLSNNITVNGNWSYVQGTVDANTSTVYINFSSTTASPIIDGQGTSATMAFNHLKLNNPARPAKPFMLAGALDVNGDLTISPTTSLNTNVSNNYPINIAGNFSMTTNPVNGFFTENNSTLTFDGTANQTIFLNDDLYNLTVNKAGGTLTLLQPLWISGSLALTNGVINTTSSNILEIENTATTIPVRGSASSYIDGPLNRQVITTAFGTKNVDLPIGASGAWRPVDLTVVHVDAAPYVYTAQVINASAKALNYTLPPAIQYVSNVRYWKITRNTTSNFISAQVKLYFDINDQVSNLGKLGIAGTTGASGTAWNNLTSGTAAGNGASPYITGSVTSTPSGNDPGLYSLANMFATTNGNSANNPLPVVFASFTGNLINGNNVNLQWSTASERGNAYFEIERSKGDGVFNTIGKVDSKGSDGSSSTINYNFTDITPNSKSNYYRIKQVDFDKKSTFSNTIEVNGGESFKVYPNPVGNDLNVRLSTQPQTNITLSIRTLVGVQIYATSISPTYYEDQIVMDCSSIKAGVYLLEISYNGLRMIKKIYKI